MMVIGEALVTPRRMGDRTGSDPVYRLQRRFPLGAGLITEPW